MLLDELKAPLSEDFSSRIPALEHALAFWTSVSQDFEVRLRLQEQRLPFILYKLLRGRVASPSSASTTTRLASLSSLVVTGIVDLVRTLVAGHEALEGELADLLIEDLERLSSHRDMDFVNRVFIPLIKVERTLPVTLSPARTAEAGQSALFEVEQERPAVQGPTSFLATELLQQKQKDYLKAAFMQIVGDKTSKTNAEKLIGANWSKIHSWSASSGEAPENLGGLGLWKLLQSRGPCVVLTTGRSPGGQQAVFGALWQGKVPAVPEDYEPGSEVVHEVEGKDGDFCFCYLPARDYHHHFTSAEDLPLAQITVEYEGVAGLVIGGSFMFVSYGNGPDGGFGYLDELDPVTISGINKPPQGSVPEDLIIETTEIWALDSNDSAEGSNKIAETESE